jgi:hypothetical protein
VGRSGGDDLYRLGHASTLAVLLAGLAVACSGDKHGDQPRSSTTGNIVGSGTAGGGGLLPGAMCPDRDGDGIADEGEGVADVDGDGRMNADDTDSDGDGAEDALERGTSPCISPVDSDRDGTPDYLDLDSDGDGIGDAVVDRALDTDRDGMPDFRDADDDGDTIGDRAEQGADPSRPIDSDRDGTPDYLDADSDNDGVPDRNAGGPAGGAVDTDGDGVFDHLDDDADGDGIADVSELGANPAMPRDTDGDKAPDFLDADSDSDGLHDGAEDANGSGTVDPGESDPIVGDTDGDGADDLIEAAAKTDPRDAKVNPQSEGNFVFVVPYQKPPAPPNATLDFTTDVVRADVVFSLDTTGSMDGELAQLRTSLRTAIIPQLAAEIPDLAFGVANYEDFPVIPFGDPGDLPINLVAPITTDSAAAQAAIDRLEIGSGNDAPESGAEALYQLATGAGVSWPGGEVAPFEVGWRAGALPILVQITDAAMNSAETYGTLVPDAVSRPELQTALEMRGAKVIAVVSADGDTATATAEYLELVRATGATVPPQAFGTSGQCETGINGAPVAPEGGSCPLLFGIEGDGSGLGTSIVEAVSALAKFAVLDIDARAENEAGNKDVHGAEVNAVAAFLDRVVPNANPATATGCVSALTTADRLAMDKIPDTFVDVEPGKRVCFDVIAKQNDTVDAQPQPQLFRARIDLFGDGVTTLDSRQVWFLVPPTPPKPGDKPPVL